MSVVSDFDQSRPATVAGMSALQMQWGDLGTLSPEEGEG